MTTWRALPRWARIVLGVYVGAFLVATASHIIDIVVQGAGVYATAPPALRVFFVALVLIDPVVVVLIVRLHRAGVIAVVAVIVADVAANLAMTLVDPAWPPPVTQSLFGVFALATSLPVFRALGPGSAPRASALFLI
jgi:hypothetical protein